MAETCSESFREFAFAWGLIRAFEQFLYGFTVSGIIYSTPSSASACGTAAIISPIKEITDRETGKVFTYGDGEPGPVSTALYNKLRAIQYGEVPDPYGWTKVII